MKILILADSLNIGGAETHIYELSRSLFSMGNEIAVLTGGGVTADKIEALGIQVHRTNAFLKLPLGLPSAAMTLWALIRDFKPSIVHSHTRRTLFVARMVCSILNTPLTFTAHANFKLGIKRLFTLPPPHILAVSQDIGNRFARLGCKEITIVNNGIDTKKFCPVTNCHPSNKIVNISRLDKDSSLAAELLCKLSQKLLALGIQEITIVGGGTDFERISALAQTKNHLIGRDYIKMAGAVADVTSYLLNRPIFVGVSRAALEAAAADCPVVLCGNEGYFGILTENNFFQAARENFCGRGCRMPSEETLLRDVEVVFHKNGSIPSVRKNITETYSAEAMAKTSFSVYKKVIKANRTVHSGKILLFGYYGFGNLGDELLKNTIIANFDNFSTAYFSSFGDKNGIWRLNFFKIIKEIRSATLIIFGGGSLLQDSTSRRSLEYYLSILRLSRLFGKEVMLYANGLGPLTNQSAKKSCKKALSAVSIIGARDKSSHRQFMEIAPKSCLCYLSCDPILMKERDGDVKDRIVFFLRRSDMRKDTLHLIAKSAAVFSERAGGRTEIIFASVNPQDKNCAERLSKLCGKSFRHLHLSTGEELENLASKSRFIISSRLHPLIVAASAYRPFITLSRDPKLSSFARECKMDGALLIELPSNNIYHALIHALELAKETETSLSNILKDTVPMLRNRGSADPIIAKTLISEHY